MALLWIISSGEHGFLPYRSRDLLSHITKSYQAFHRKKHRNQLSKASAPGWRVGPLQNLCSLFLGIPSRTRGPILAMATPKHTHSSVCSIRGTPGSQVISLSVPLVPSACADFAEFVRDVAANRRRSHPDSSAIYTSIPCSYPWLLRRSR